MFGQSKDNPDPNNFTKNRTALLAMVGINVYNKGGMASLRDGP